LGASRGPLGAFLRAFWGPPGSVLGRPGAPWGRLGALLGRLGALLGASGAVLGRSWRLIRPSWTLCRLRTRLWQKCTFSEGNGAIFASWGSFRKPQGAASERLEPSWSRLRGVPRRSGAVLGRPLRDRGRSEGSAAAPVAARGGSERRRARWERPGGGRFDATESFPTRAERCIVGEMMTSVNPWKIHGWQVEASSPAAQVSRTPRLALGPSWRTLGLSWGPRGPS